MLPAPTAHSLFEVDKSLGNLLKDSIDIQTICISQLMNISSIILPRDKLNENNDKLKYCGYTEKIFTNHGNDVIMSTPKSKDVSLPNTFPQDVILKNISHTNNSDEIKIGKRVNNTTLIFPRVYWPGYTAEFNNKIIPVTQDKTGALVKIDIPAGEEGVLRLSYFPKTWRTLWFLPLFSLMIMCFICFRLTNIKCIKE